MDEKYLQDLYALIKGNDSSYGAAFSYDQFKAKIQEKEYATKMHTWLSGRDEATRKKPVGQFVNDAIISVPVQKKKFSLDSESPPPKEAAPTGLSLADGSLATQPTNKKFASFTKEDLVKADTRVKSDQEKFLADRIKNTKELADISKETEKRQKQEQKESSLSKSSQKNQLSSFNLDDNFLKALGLVDSKLTSKREEDAINTLKSNFSQYGINFEESGFGTNKIIAKTIDGKKTTEIDFNNFTEQGSAEASEKLKKFIKENASVVNKASTGSILENSLKAQNLRKVGRLNADGTTSTVKMTSFEEDGKFKVIPTLFPKDPNNYSTNPNTWVELPFSEALKQAKLRGEVFDFSTDKEAKTFAKGSWKDISKIDSEGEKFYKERGLDYMSNKKTYEEYVKVRDMIDFIEDNENDKKIDQFDERSSKYKSLIVNGRLRSDSSQLLQKYKAQEEALKGQVFDAGFFSDGKIEKTREDFDVYLTKKQNEIAKQAAETNNKARLQKATANEESLSNFNIPIDKLSSYQPISNEEIVKKDQLLKLYEDSKITQDFAARKYENAKTYFDTKINKQIQGEYEDNWAGTINSVKDAFNNGQAAQQILAITLGIKDIDSKTDKNEAARIIVENLADQSGTQSRAMSRWQQARGFSETFDVLLNDPLELMGTFVATSLAQIAPYGVKIVPAAVATGTATGAALGLAGGPFAGVTVPGGATIGAVQGLKTGMAATSLAMEYTNSVLDVMREKGYDLANPDDVEAGLSDESVWAEGGERGLKRGIPIAVIDYLSAGLAGRVFKPASVISSRATKIGGQVAERAIFDPAAEAFGEGVAQVSSGQEIDWKEISAEALGGLGNNSSNMAVNLYRGIANNTNIEIAKKLTDISFVGTETASDEKISNWANNMERLKKIDADVNQRIQLNVGLRRDAKEVLSVGESNVKASPAVVSRTMELMAAKQELSSSTNRREVYSEKIQGINAELAIIAETKELASEEKSIDLSLTLGTTRKGLGQYMIDGVSQTREQLIEKAEGMTARRLLRSALGVKNDEETGEIIQAIIEKKKAELIDNELSSLIDTEEDIDEVVPVAETFTEEQSVRKVELEEALAKTINAEETITIGETTLSREDAVAELQALSAEEVSSVVSVTESILEEANVAVKSNKIEGGFLNKEQAENLQNEIESKYNDSGVMQFGQSNEDIRQKLYNYDNPFAQKDVNGVNLRIAEGLIEQEPISNKKRKTFLLYADGKIIGKFYSVADIKQSIKFIESNLITNIENETTEQVQLEGGRDGARRDNSRSVAPLEGAPSIQGVNGPDPQLVAVAEAYAEANGIELKRQAEYVEVDEDRARTIADAYEQMENNPQDPTVKEAYQNLIKQTAAQYQALVDAGYKFWFMDLNIPSNVEYASSPYNASRDLRTNKQMGVFPTTDGFGTGDLDVSNNPLLEFTGIMWPVGGLDGEMKPVLANDLFRAVHDAFGHGLEGAGFRARGEENAWQAHSRLYTGSAVGAMTSETRGQNSWVNFGPNGDANRSASAEDTVFADQKVGLMPESTWTEGRAADMQDEVSSKTQEENTLPLLSNKNIQPLTDTQNERTRRISEQKDINKRANRGNKLLSGLLEKYSKKSIKTRGINKESVRGIKRLGLYDLNVVAEYVLDNVINQNLKRAFPNFKGVQKIYEVTDGATYREMMISSLKDNKFSASVTVHSAEVFNGMRMFVTEDGSTGITITKEGFLGGAFSDPTAKRPQNLSQLVILGIKEGATTAEAFDTMLPDYYSNFGFKAVSRTAFNDAFKPMVENGNAVKDWSYLDYERYNNGKPDIVFFIYDGGNRETIEDRIGSFDLYQSYEKENTQAFDENSYDEAKEVMNQQAVKRLEFELGIDETADSEVSSKTQGLSEAELPGFDRMIVEVDGIIKKSKSRRVGAQKMVDNVMSYVMGSKVYENATDVQREALVRKIRKDFGLKEKSAPSVGRILGTIKNVTKITMTEKTALKKQIKYLARGAKDAVRAFRSASNQLSKEIKELKKTGKITTTQAANINRAFSNVNVFSETSVQRFIDYMTKVFKNADYANNVAIAKETRASIKTLSKNDKKNPNLRELGAAFAAIDPLMVEDIESYNEIAKNIQIAIKGSSIKKERAAFVGTVNIKDANKYVSEEIKRQEKILKDEKIAEIESLYGIDASSFSQAEVAALLTKDQPMSEKNDKIVKEAVKEAFEIYKNRILSAIEKGVDPMTGEDFKYSAAQKDIILKFLDMDTDKMDSKIALGTVDSLLNFLVNNSTAGMSSVHFTYMGNINAQKVADKGIFAITLKKYFSEGIGKVLAEQTTNLPIVFEKLFKGVTRGGYVQDLMGLTKLINGKAFAENNTNSIVKDYVSKFYKKNIKPNGQAFNTAYNDTERAMSSFMMRNVIGDVEQMQVEFKRRKGLIEQSISALAQGDIKEKEKGLLYQQIYDKILVNSTNIQDIKDNTDPINLEAIDAWNKIWASKFDRLSDVALNVYNKVLKKGINYSSPDRYTRMKGAPKEVDLEETESAFIFNTNGVLYDRNTGRLEDVTETANLPQNSNKKPLSYIDLSFDRNNSSSLYDALVDIETAGPIRQVQAFLNSDNFSKIIPNTADANLLKGRIDLYVRNIRNKSPYSNDELSNFMRSVNKVATLGVSQALAGGFQPIKQVVPASINTLINAGTLDLGKAFDPAYNLFLNNLGYGISNRGVESTADIDSINTLIEQAADSSLDKATKLIEDANKKMLKILLVSPDVAIARASWGAYYEQSLKKQGIDVKGLDYSTHIANEQAANYAQRMVDRQQNVSDIALSGALFSSRETGKEVIVKLLMPFASFRMNQSSRVGSDLSTLGYWNVSTREDKIIAARSLAGFAAEVVTFRTISAGISISMGYLVLEAMGRTESEEEEEKRINNIIKGQFTGGVIDFFSPVPMLDMFIQTGVKGLIDTVNEVVSVSEEDRVNIYGTRKEDFVKNLGMYGIALDRASQLYDLISISTTGKYKDEFGKEKEISEADQKALQLLIGPAIITNFGLGTAEFATLIRGSVKTAKKTPVDSDKAARKEEKAAQAEIDDNLDVEILKEMMENTRDSDVEALIQQRIDRIDSETPEEKEERLEKSREIKEQKIQLLGEYKNESEMKRFDRAAWEENFGENSEWYETFNEEKLILKELEKEKKNLRDEEFDYSPEKKPKKIGEQRGFKRKKFAGPSNFDKDK